MPLALVKEPFIMRDGRALVMIGRGDQALSQAQFDHAKKCGFLAQDDSHTAGKEQQIKAAKPAKSEQK